VGYVTTCGAEVTGGTGRCHARAVAVARGACEIRCGISAFTEGRSRFADGEPRPRRSEARAENAVGSWCALRRRETRRDASDGWNACSATRSAG